MESHSFLERDLLLWIRESVSACFLTFHYHGMELVHSKEIAKIIFAFLSERKRRKNACYDKNLQRQKNTLITELPIIKRYSFTKLLYNSSLYQC